MRRSAGKFNKIMRIGNKTVNLQNFEDTNWLKIVRNEKKPSIKEVEKKYIKETGLKNPSFNDLVKFLNKRKKKAKEEWTKQEWESYKKEHPATELKPKIKKETTKKTEKKTLKKQLIEITKEENISGLRNDLEAGLKVGKLEKYEKQIVDKVLNNIKEYAKVSPEEITPFDIAFDTIGRTGILDFKEGIELEKIIKKAIYKHLNTGKSPELKDPEADWHRKSPVAWLGNIEVNYDKDKAEKHFLTMRKKLNEATKIQNMIAVTDELRGYITTYERFSDIFKENLKPEQKESMQEAEKILTDYTAEGYDDFSGVIVSQAMEQIFGGTEPDYRMKKWKEENKDKKHVTTEKEVEGYRLMMKKEQELLKNTGLVDEEGYLYVYRNSDQFNKTKEGEEIETEGNYVDSWSLTPGRFQGGTSITNNSVRAKIHISQVITSCFGKGNVWNWADENEVCVCSKYIRAKVIGKIESEEYDSLNEENKKYYEMVKKRINDEDLVSKIHETEEKEQKIIQKLNKIPNPKPKQLEDLRKMLSPEKKNMPLNKLIILFKTLAKRGYFSEK
jgi:hypothetical protein